MNAIKRIEKTLDFLEESFRKKALSLFGQLLKSELPAQVMRSMRQAKEEPGKLEEILSGFEMPGRKRYIALFERYVQELFIQGMNLGIKEIDAKREAARSKRVGFAIEVTGDPVLPAGAIKWMDSWTETFGNNYYDDVTKDVVRVMKNALEAGYSVPDVIDGLKQYLTGEQYTKARLEVIARTNATTAFNQGRLETFRQNSDFVKAVKYSSILDTRTTDICKSRHGKIMLLDSEEMAANTPPLHYQCRSILLPVDKFSWEDMQGSPKLKEKLDWTKWKDETGQAQDVPNPGKGFGNVGVSRVDKTDGSYYPTKKRGNISAKKERIIKKLEQDGRLYIEPNIVSKLSADYKRIIKSEDSFIDLVHQQFEDIPESLLKLMEKQSSTIAITNDVKVGEYSRLTRIAKINPEAIIKQDGVFQEEVIHLLDHLLGGQPENVGITLSGGFGINEKVQKLGKEIKALYDRGESYYFFGYMGKNEREYLAQAARQFLQDDPEIIAELDVLLYNMLKDKFFNEQYWSNML